MSAKFKQVIYAGQKLVDESGGGSNYQEKSVTPSETAQTVQADSGYDALSKVYVDAISSDYVGSGVARKSSSDIALSGATLTAPAGYYENDATKSLSEQAAATITPTNTDQTAVAANKFTTGAVTVEGVVCSNLSAENIVSGVTVKVGTATDDDSVASVTGTASGGGGDDEKWKDFIEVNAPLDLTNSTASRVGSMAFYLRKDLSNVSFTNVSAIYNQAFANCSGLSNVYFPSCINISSSGFYSCYGLTELTSSQFPILKYVMGSAFASCSGISNIDLPTLNFVGVAAFASCYSLKTCNLPEADSLGSSCFSNCSILETISVPKVLSVYNYAFWHCKKLSILSLPSVKSIAANAFNDCTTLLSLYLLNSVRCNLSTSNAFTNTPIAGYTADTGGVYGSIFVPGSLYSNYITATNWAIFSSRFVSLTDAQIAAL